MLLTIVGWLYGVYCYTHGAPLDEFQYRLIRARAYRAIARTSFQIDGVASGLTTDRGLPESLRTSWRLWRLRGDYRF